MGCDPPLLQRPQTLRGVRNVGRGDDGVGLDARGADVIHSARARPRHEDVGRSVEQRGGGRHRHPERLDAPVTHLPASLPQGLDVEAAGVVHGAEHCRHGDDRSPPPDHFAGHAPAHLAEALDRYPPAGEAAQRCFGRSRHAEAGHDVLEGDASKQFDAIWNYLLAGRRIEHPEQEEK